MRTLVIALLIVAPLSAQQPASDAIPRELALALIDRFGPPREERADIIVGRVPPSFPPNVLPANANVLGGIERAPAAHVVLAFREPPDTVLARLVRHLEGGRWDRDEYEPRGGFVPSPSSRSHGFCRRDISLRVSVSPRTGGGSLAHLGSWKGPDDYRCGEGRRRDMGGFDRVDLPSLHTPSGARMLGSGMGGGGRESTEAFIRLETPMHSIDLAAHFAKQLASAGWTITGPTLGEGIVVYGVRRRDDEDRALGGVLYILDIPGTQQRDAVFRVVRMEPTR